MQKILIAIDGSDPSLVAVRYVGRLFAKQSHIALLHVISDIPEAIRDMHANASALGNDPALGLWRAHQEQVINDLMQQAQDILVDAGFANETITAHVQPMQTGIARDIINESHQSYSVLVVGRTGVSNIEDIRMGSVTSKLVETIGHLPLVVVGEGSESKKIMIALDGSEGSMKAVEYAGALLDPADCEVLFTHVIRPLKIQQLSSREIFKQKHEEQWIATNHRKIVPVISEAKKRLLEAGFRQEQISNEILTYQKSRAAAIVKAAEVGGYHTIMLGRRGLTSVGEFRMGRVSRKILRFAFRPTLWVVN